MLYVSLILLKNLKQKQTQKKKKKKKKLKIWSGSSHPLFMKRDTCHIVSEFEAAAVK
jgi:hypothetical protein